MEGIKIRKGEKTKQYVIEKTALLLNRQGYLTTSLAEITNETGLQKGGLYNHFKDKEELLSESFIYCCASVNKMITSAVDAKTTSFDKLQTFIETYIDLEFPGGCPIANVAIEADSASPVLFQQAQEAMSRLSARMESIITAGIEKEEFRPSVKPDESALFILSAIEGALMLRKLFPSSPAVAVTKNQLVRYINEEIKAPVQS